MAEQLARVSPEIELCYETFGDPATTPRCCSIMGLGTQMVAWHEDFCERARRPRLLRHPLRQPRHAAARRTSPTRRRRRSAAARARKRDAAAYTLADMAGDAVGAARPPRHRAGAHRRRLDGRDDRPDDRDPLPRARALARLDHVQHRRPAQRPAGARRCSRLAAGRRRATASGYIEHARRSSTRRSARPASSTTRPRCATMIARSASTAAHDAAGPRPPARRRSSPTATARRSCAALTCPRSSSTAPPTSSSRRPAAARPPRRSRARGCSRSTAWATTSRAAPGRRSSTRSPRPPPAPAARPRAAPNGLDHQDQHDREHHDDREDRGRHRPPATGCPSSPGLDWSRVWRPSGGVPTQSSSSGAGMYG